MSKPSEIEIVEDRNLKTGLSCGTYGYPITTKACDSITGTYEGACPGHTPNPAHDISF